MELIQKNKGNRKRNQNNRESGATGMASNASQAMNVFDANSNSHNGQPSGVVPKRVDPFDEVNTDGGSAKKLNFKERYLMKKQQKQQQEDEKAYSQQHVGGKNRVEPSGLNKKTVVPNEKDTIHD